MRHSPVLSLLASLLLALFPGCPETYGGDDDDDDDSAAGDDDDVTGTLLADSEEEYSDVQGQDNWHYGYWDRTADEETGDGAYDASSDFQEMTDWFDKWGMWHVDEGVGGYWTAIGSTGMHPNGENANEGRLSARHWAIRRWTSEITGYVSIRSEFYSLDTAGDGVDVRVLVDGVEQFTVFLDAWDEEGVAPTLCVEVQDGMPIDFVVTDGDHGDDANDYTYHHALIHDMEGSCR